MATETLYKGKSYRLRASTPMPTDSRGDFVLHTFMAEKSDIDIFACTTSLPGSSEFRGQGGNLMNASFSRLNIKGGEYFSGKQVYAPSYVEEGDI